MMYGVIYKITCSVNGKVYIGQTIRPLDERFKRHLNDAEKAESPKIKFQRAIKKYGAQNFYIEKIDEASSKEELDLKEKFWINSYDSTKKGYNSALGGEGGNTYYGRTDGDMEATSRKISNALKGRKNGNSDQIKCISIKTGEEHFFETLGECLNFFGIKNHQVISDRARGKINTFWRDEWKFAFEDNDYGEYVFAPDRKTSGRTVLLIKDGKTFSFVSKNKACQFLGLKRAQLIDNSIINGYEVHIS